MGEAVHWGCHAPKCLRPAWRPAPTQCALHGVVRLPRGQWNLNVNVNVLLDRARACDARAGAAAARARAAARSGFPVRPKKAPHLSTCVGDGFGPPQLHAPVLLNASPAPTSRMGWPQRGLCEQPRKAAADARVIVYVRFVVPSLGHRASSAAMRGWSRAWCRVL